VTETYSQHFVNDISNGTTGRTWPVMQSDRSIVSHSARSLPDVCLALVVVISSAAILVYVRSLIFFTMKPVLFDAAHLVALLAVSILLVRWKLGYNSQVFLVLLSNGALMFITPLRLPEGIITNGPDMIYELQIIQNIITTGAITLTSPTVYALNYVFTPAMETLLAMASMVLGTPAEPVIKYAGPLFGVLTVVFLIGFYKAYLPSREALIAAFVAGNCSWFLQSSTIHETLALVFLSVAIYSLTKPGAMWRVLTVVFVFGTVATHEFTAIVSSFFFVLAAFGIIVLSHTFGLKRGSIENAMMKMPGLMITVTFAWLAFIALPFFATAVGLVDFIARTLLAGSTPLAFPLTPSSAIPTSWTRVAGDVGVVLFAFSCCAGSIAVLWLDSGRYKQALPYAVGSAIVFFLGLVSYFRFHQATDLLSRGFLYVYFFSAPIAVFAILKVAGRVSRRVSLQQLLCVALICIMVVSGVYYNYPRYTYDNTAQGNIEDVRFPLFQWRSAGYFTLNHTGLHTLWGDKIAFDYVGGYGQKDVTQIDPTLNITLVQWMATYPSSGDVVVLRKSMVTVPFWNYEVSTSEFHQILATHDVIYSSGEVIMLVES